jgi:hypothetical protein
MRISATSSHIIMVIFGQFVLEKERMTVEG